MLTATTSNDATHRQTTPTDAPALGDTMAALHAPEYGPLDGLRIGRLPIPSVGSGQVLVRVHATSLHVGDVFTCLGRPFPIRLAMGLRRPRPGIPGFDVAGVVAAVGSDVTHFAVGDAVFGCTDAGGACAEFFLAPEDNLAPMPASLAFTEAAALPTAGLAALHALRDTMNVQAGQRVLVVGASGGVGSLAVQLAGAMGAEVDGVSSATNAALVQELGATPVDYKSNEYLSIPDTYDSILDNVEARPLGDLRAALKPEGTLVLNSGTGASGLRFFARLISPLLLDPFTKQRLRRFLSVPNSADLQDLAARADAGSLRPIIDRVVSVDEVPGALAHIASGRARGRVVVDVAGSGLPSQA